MTLKISFNLETFNRNYTSSLFKQIVDFMSVEIEYCLDCKYYDFCNKHLKLLSKKMRQLEDDEN